MSESLSQFVQFLPALVQNAGRLCIYSSPRAVGLVAAVHISPDFFRANDRAAAPALTTSIAATTSTSSKQYRRREASV
jgi:hypothetical protein